MATTTAPPIVWHCYATEPHSPYAYTLATVPDTSAWWFPAVHRFALVGGRWVPMGAITYDRYEASDAIRAALKRGWAVEVWDACPTCAGRMKFAAGPCSPLSCAIGRPLRGQPPRFR